ncbi:MAG: 5-(carboxyamino)imidazole ribonucleotide synthase [Candidatus Cyclobacteriaceae bacterium M2_1C_046]
MIQEIGLLGGGQLGRMLIQAAIDLDIAIHVLDRDKDSSCRHLSTSFTQGVLTDFDTVYNFGKQFELVTIEIENVNTEALKKLEQEGIKVYPQADVIALIQDKRTQKEFYKKNNIPTADFHLVENKEEVFKHQDWLPFVNKLGREGYDGRGVQVMRSIKDLEKAFDARGLVEKLIDFEKELSVLVARSANGEVSTYPVAELVFHPQQNMVEYLFAPAEIDPEIEEKARTVAQQVVESIGIVGLLAVEMFLTKDGEILVNEIAPRPHNSGHHTIEACVTSQYEQHLRAIMGLPLGDTKLLMPSAMVNLLGEPDHKGPVFYEGLEDVLSMSSTYIHLYGKKMTKPFRKMGHVTLIADDLKSLKENALIVKDKIKVKSK